MPPSTTPATDGLAQVIDLNARRKIRAGRTDDGSCKQCGAPDRFWCRYGCRYNPSSDMP